MSNLQNALQELKVKRDQAQMEVEKLNHVISGIESLNGIEVPHNTNQPKRTISAASRRKMALAQRKRWASLKKGSQSVSAPSIAPAKRTMSAAARKRISLVQKARWAKIRAAKKAA
jgi:hypothetical protein